MAPRAALTAAGNYIDPADARADVLDYLDCASGELAALPGPAARACGALVAAAVLALA